MLADEVDAWPRKVCVGVLAIVRTVVLREDFAQECVLERENRQKPRMFRADRLSRGKDQFRVTARSRH